MRVIYIVGTSHSGSTLLDLMLNAHPAIFAGGEVLKLNRQLQVKDPRWDIYAPCACGVPSLWQCPFWSRVDERTRTTSGKSLVDLDVLDHAELDPSRAPNAILFEAMAETSGKPFIVNSSKLPKRLSYLLRLKDLDVYPVHLIREPKGQIHSVRRKHGGLVKHIFRYELIHAQISRMLRSVPHSLIVTRIWCAIRRPRLKACSRRSGSISIRVSSTGPTPRSMRSPAIAYALTLRARSFSTPPGATA